MKLLVKHIRGVERALGSDKKEVLSCELSAREKCRS
jgi:hypothetical protein